MTQFAKLNNILQSSAYNEHFFASVINLGS